MPDLVYRLSGTLDELERVAREAQDDGLNPEWHGRGHAVFAYGGDTVTVHAALESVATHIARWDPQAVLRLVAAMRKIVEMYQTATDGRTASARTRDLDLASAMGRKVALGNVIELLIAAMEPSNE